MSERSVFGLEGETGFFAKIAAFIGKIATGSFLFGKKKSNQNK